MSSYVTRCPECNVQLRVNISSMNVPGGKEVEEGHCPQCNKLIVKEMTSGFIRVEIVENTSKAA